MQAAATMVILHAGYTYLAINVQQLIHIAAVHMVEIFAFTVYNLPIPQAHGVSNTDSNKL